MRRLLVFRGDLWHRHRGCRRCRMLPWPGTTTCSDLPLIHHSPRWISWKSVLRVPLCVHSRWCLEAVVRVIVNPVNSVVPAMCEYYKNLDLDHRKIVGVTTLDVVRTTSSPPLKGLSMRDAQISVLIGHADVTILPPFSQCPGWAARPRGSGGGSRKACARWEHRTGLGPKLQPRWQLRACRYAAHSCVR